MAQLKNLTKAVEKLKGSAETVREDLDEKRERWDGKSDAWQESKEGQEWDEHLDNIEALLDEIDNLEPIEGHSEGHSNALKQRVETLKRVIRENQDDLKRYMRGSTSENAEGIDYDLLIKGTKREIEHRLIEISLTEALIAHIKLAL